MIVYGKNTVRESIASGKATKVMVFERYQNDPMVAMARKNGIEVKFASMAECDRLSSSGNHQGFLAVCEDYPTYSVEDIISSAKSKQYPLVLMLDGIEDPHNLGAIIRSCDAFGIDGIVMKNRNQAPVNSTVAKVSTGAIDYVKIATVPNLSRAIEKFQKAGYWVVSSDGSAKQTYDQVDYKCPIVVIVGSEGFGISRLVLENSDFIVKIPMEGHVNSLNVSVATGILLSTIQLLRK